MWDWQERLTSIAGQFGLNAERVTSVVWRTASGREEGAASTAVYFR
jgi:hypothetical protein